MGTEFNVVGLRAEAQRLGIRYRRALHMVHRGRLPGLKIGTVWLIRPGALDAYAPAKASESPRPAA